MAVSLSWGAGADDQAGQHSVNIPDGAYDIEIDLRGGRGGNGGADASSGGGAGGRTCFQTFTLVNNFLDRNFIISVGGRGGNGTSNQGNGAGGAPGAGDIAGPTQAAGGRGGNSGNPPFSGAGGGGGGASIFARVVGTTVTPWIVMGGAGGGGGASLNRGGGGGGSVIAATGSATVSTTDGGQGGKPGGDGGGGGGGGGGSNGGGGGGGGSDNGSGGGGGGRGGSRYLTTEVNASTAVTGQTTGLGYAALRYKLKPRIDSFSASPDPVDSSNGTPSYTVQLIWTTTYASSVNITSDVDNFTNLSANGTLTLNNLPQSEAGVNSPATRTYTLTAVNPDTTTTATLELDIFNDNTPSNVNIPSTVLPGNVPIDNLAKTTEYYFDVDFDGVDMNVIVQSASSGVDISTNGGATWGNSRLVDLNLGSFSVRFTSLDYNTDPTPTGFTNAQGEALGSLNTKTIQFSIGSQVYGVDVSTRRPVIEETFDSTGNSSYFPFPDVDVVPPEPTTANYIFSDETLLNDIEIDVEIKVSDPDAQVQIDNDGTWRNMREI